MIRRDRRAALGMLGSALASGVLAGCAGAPRTDYRLLRDAGPQQPPLPGPRSDRVLLLASGGPPALYDTDRMVFSADGSSRSYFQFGFWADRPQRELLRLAEARLVQAQAFSGVALATSGVRGDLLLTLRLESLYLDAAASPAQARLAFGAELVDWRSRSLLGRKSFALALPASQADAEGFADAAGRAVGVLLGELTDWAAATGAKAGPAA